MEIKENDVYYLSYSEAKSTGSSNHCFDGQLYVWKDPQDNQLYLIDTYWDELGEHPHGDTRRRTLDEMLKRGNLKFVCNLADVEECTRKDSLYYADEDVFDLSRQHHYSKRFYKRKGAEKSIDKIREILMEDIEYIQSQISSLEGDLRWAKEKLANVESGDMNVSLSGYRR